MWWEPPGGNTGSGCKSDGPIGLVHEVLEVGELDAQALEESGPVGAQLR